LSNLRGPFGTAFSREKPGNPAAGAQDLSRLDVVPETAQGAFGFSLFRATRHPAARIETIFNPLAASQSLIR
jgi:hypothetical protein